MRDIYSGAINFSGTKNTYNYIYLEDEKTNQKVK